MEARTRRSSENHFFFLSPPARLRHKSGTCDKMDYDTAGNMQAQDDEMSNKMMSMVIKVGCKKDVVEKITPVLPIAGRARTGRARWVVVDTTEIHPDTSHEVLDKVCRLPFPSSE